MHGHSTCGTGIAFAAFLIGMRIRSETERKPVCLTVFYATAWLWIVFFCRSQVKSQNLQT